MSAWDDLFATYGGGPPSPPATGGGSAWDNLFAQYGGAELQSPYSAPPEEEPGLGLGRSFASGLFGAAGNVVSGAEAFLRSPLTPMGIADLLLPGRPFGAVIEETMGRISEPLLRRAAELAPPPAETFLGRAAQTVAGAAPQLAGIVGAGILTGGVAAPAVLGGAMAAGASLEEAEARELDDTLAEIKALASGAGGAALEAVGGGAIARLFKTLPRGTAASFAQRTGQAMMAEGLTEAGQELYEAGLEAATGSDEAFDNIQERMALAAIAGATLGGVASGPAAIANHLSPAPTPLSPGEARAHEKALQDEQRYHTLPPEADRSLAGRMTRAARGFYTELFNRNQPLVDLAKRLNLATTPVDLTTGVIQAAGSILERVGPPESPSSKPQGLYLAPGKSLLTSDLEGERLRFRTAAVNALDVSGPDLIVRHARFSGVGGSGPVSAGIKALAQLVPATRFQNLLSADRETLNNELRRLSPGVDPARFTDSYEVLEAIAGVLARKSGYDAIVDNNEDPRFSEYVALKNSALAAAPRQPLSPEQQAQRTTQMLFNIHQVLGSAELANSTLIQRPTQMDPGSGRNVVPVTQVDLGPLRGVVQRPEGVKTPLELLSPYGHDPERLRMLSMFLAAQRDVFDLGPAGKTEEDVVADRRATLAELQRNAPELYQAFEGIAQGLREWSVVTILDPLVEVGRLSKASRDRILAENEHYAPFFRLRVEHGDFQAGDSPGVRRIRKGSTEDDPSVDPIEGFLRKALSTQKWVTRQRLRNMVGDWSEEFADVFPDIQQLIPETRAVATVENAEGDLETIYRPSLDRPDNSFTVWRDGKASFYQSSDPLLMKAIDRLTPQQLNALLKILRIPAATLRAGATSTPEFAISNLFRDQVTAAVNAKYGYVPVWDMALGALEVLKRGDLFEEMRRSGGMISNLIDVDRDFKVHDLQDLLLYERKGVSRELGHWKQALKRPIRTVAQIGRGEDVFDNLTSLPGELMDVFLHPFQRASGFLELATRTGVARRATKGSPILGRVPGLNFQAHGTSTPQAVEAMRESSLDFGRMGHFGAMWNSVEAFANAALQDPDRYARSMRKAPGHTLLMTGALITLPAMLNFLMNYDDEEYQNTPDWEKTVYYHIPAARWPTGERVRIPRPIGLMNFLGGVLIERLMGRVVDEDPAAAVELKEALLRDTPLGLVGSPIDALPSAIQPVAEAFASPAGFEQFRQRNIVPQGVASRRLPAEQHQEWTSASMKELGAATGVSPMKLEFLTRAYFGTAGRWGLDIADRLTSNPQQQHRRGGASEKPIARRFASRPPTGPNSRPVEDFYRIVKQAEQQEGSYNQIVREQGAVPTDESARRFPLVPWRRSLTRARRRFSEIMDARGAAVRAENWQEVDRIDAMLTTTSRQFLEEIGVYRRPGSSSAVEQRVDARLRAWIGGNPNATPWQIAAARRRLYDEEMLR